MTYSVKEIYFTLQGEGAQTGRAAVFLRFSGCNLWSGREQHRAEAVCKFCDTDFVGTDGPGGGKFASAESLAEAITNTWPEKAVASPKYVVCTGGEPLLQLDTVAIDGIDWLCVSPKANAPVVQRSGSELKLVYPQNEDAAQPSEFADLDFEYFFLQPCDDENLEANTRAAVDYCLQHPQWRLSVQTHKILGID